MLVVRVSTGALVSVLVMLYNDHLVLGEETAITKAQPGAVRLGIQVALD